MGTQSIFVSQYHTLCRQHFKFHKIWEIFFSKIDHEKVVVCLVIYILLLAYMCLIVNGISA